MDHSDPSRRQYAQSTFPLQQTQQQQQQHQQQQQPQQQQQQQQQQQRQQPQSAAQPTGQYGYGSVDRFRGQQYMQHSPTSTSNPASAGGDSQGLYGFQATQSYTTLPSMSASAMAYSQEPQTPDQTRPSQFAQYGSNIVYGMAQNPAQSNQSPYEPPSYRQRASGAAEAFGAQFAVPQTAQYYLAGQAGPPATPTTELSGSGGAQQISSQYPQSSYQQPNLTTSSFGSAMIDPSPSSAYPAFPQASSYSSQTSTQNLDQGFSNYQVQVRNIFTHTRDGTLQDLGQQLLEISQYLLGNAEVLGLTRDEESQHDERIRLWDEFNNAWLVALQRQFDMAQEMLQTGQTPQDPQSIMTVQTLEQLSRELVRLCDSIEKHGLVDYQMGVAEEEIMDLLLRCLSLLDPPSDQEADAVGGAESSPPAMGQSR